MLSTQQISLMPYIPQETTETEISVFNLRPYNTSNSLCFNLKKLNPKDISEPVFELPSQNLFFKLKKISPFESKIFFFTLKQHQLYKNLQKTNTSRCINNEEHHVDNVNGEFTCIKCGLVLEKHIITNETGYRCYDNYDREKREHYGPGLPTHIPQKKNLLSTVICNRNADYNGNKIDPKKTSQMKRLRKMNKNYLKNTRDYANLSTMKHILNTELKSFGLSDFLINEIFYIYQTKVLNNDNMKFRNIRYVLFALTYHILKKTPNVKTVNQMCGHFELDRSKFISHMRLVGNNIEISNSKRLIKPIDLIPNICNAFLKHETQKIITKVKQVALRTMKKTNAIYESENNIEYGNGLNNVGIACASIFFAISLLKVNFASLSKYKVSHFEEDFKITPVTIKKRYDEIIQVIFAEAEYKGEKIKSLI